MESPSFSGSSKRAKAPVNTSVAVICLVDGCNVDLSLCRDYHRRHKVCEIHSKTPKVSIGGREQRFCQQCSRFHSLVEFDDEKKSCRKRLEGHNRRRRKPQPETLSRNPGLTFSTPENLNGPRLLSFETPQILPSSRISSSWAGPVKPGKNTIIYIPQQPNCIGRQNSYPADCSYHSYKGLNQLPFVQEATISRPFLDSNQVVDSDRALSLLSSAPPLNEPLHQPHPLVHNFNYNGLSPFTFGHESERVVPITGSGKGSSLNFGEMFQLGSQGSSTNEPNQTLTFMWE